MLDLLVSPEILPWAGLVLGSILGSFLNVCAHRLPIGKSIVLPASHCPNCGTTIPWFRNLPVLTWLFQKGKAHCCSYSIPVRYWLVEISLGLVFAYFAHLYSVEHNPVLLAARLLFSWIMVAVIVIDFETMLIPDRFSVGGAMVGVLYCFLFPEINGMHVNDSVSVHFESGLNSILGLLVGSALLYWIGALAQITFGREALGEGDIKLLGCIGAFCGWKGAVFSIFGGALMGTLLLLPAMLFQRLLRKGGKQINSDQELQWGGEVPFGPYLAVAGIFYFAGASVLIDPWFDPILWFFDNTSAVSAF